MKINRFEDILAWQKAKELAVIVHGQFNGSRDYAFRDQIQRASVSVMNNIAEGFERNSDNELRQFLYIAKGSCGEVRSMLILAAKFDYLTEAQYKKSYNLVVDISKLLSGFIKKI
jgi:four helix bundle protein